MSSDPTKDLAAFFADLRYELLPAAVRERVIDIVLDTVASAIAGRRGDETAQIEALAASIGGPPGSTVIAGPPRSLAGATLVNGYQVTAVTVCDIHRPTLCHVTPEVVPPALAIAEQRDLGGRDLLVAVAAGLETVVRVGAGMRYPSMRARGWHSPGVIGPFGGAAGGRLAARARAEPASTMRCRSPAPSRPAPSRTGARRRSSSTSRAARFRAFWQACSPSRAFRPGRRS